MISSFLLLFFAALVWSLMQPSRVERCIAKALEIQSIVPISEEIQNITRDTCSIFSTKNMELLWKDIQILQNTTRPLSFLCLKPQSLQDINEQKKIPENVGASLPISSSKL